MDIKEFMNRLIIHEVAESENALLSLLLLQENEYIKERCVMQWQDYDPCLTLFKRENHMSFMRSKADILDSIQYNVINEKTGDVLDVMPVTAKIMIKIKDIWKTLVDLNVEHTVWKLNGIPLLKTQQLACGMKLYLEFIDEIPDAVIKVKARLGYLSDMDLRVELAQSVLYDGNIRYDFTIEINKEEAALK